ncbi:MAG TPA: hypothetical protein VK255_02305, partial [Patescibacteria group bacterium]|nr:hypothetical protein [Patescibacteria group bacterium]
MSDKNKSREIDKLVEEVASYQKKDLQFTKKSKIRIRYAVAVTAFILGSVLAIIWLIWLRMEQKSGASFVKSPLMTIIKTKGCVADGLLTGSGGKTSELLEMINRSECNYLHRSIETWLAPPDFDRISQNMAKIEKRGVIYGMFLAEAINPNAKYDYPAEKRKFDFSKMCKEGSVGFWGEGTCKASFDSKEYRLYLEYITKTAIDLGVQNFLFGQIYFQENNGSPRAAKIVEEMRSYAISKGKSIVVGAQTNDMGDPGYLKLFDYIEGGVGINPKGEIEDGPCFSKWWKKPGDRCWALLWHKDFSSNANDVLLNFDWSG